MQNCIYFLVLFIATSIDGSLLYEQCDQDENCKTVDAYCHNGLCACKENFVMYSDSCVEIAQPVIACTTKELCMGSLGNRSLCEENKCVCFPFHHVHDKICYKNRGLNENCDAHYQCYWGRNMLDKMACINGECSCKPGYRPHNGRICEQHSASITQLFSVGLIIAALTIAKLI